MNHIPEPRKHFKGVWIPKEIWEDNSLTWLDKALLAEIWALSGDDGCFASNEYLASKFDVTEATMKNKISILRKRGYVKTVRFDGRSRWLKVCWDHGFHGTGNVTSEVTKSVTPDVTESVTPAVTKPVTPHYIVEKKERENSRSGRKNTTTSPSDDSKAILFDDQIFSILDVPDKAWDRVCEYALSCGIPKDRINDFVDYLVRRHTHLRIPAKGLIYGLNRIIANWLKQNT